LRTERRSSPPKLAILPVDSLYLCGDRFARDCLHRQDAQSGHSFPLLIRGRKPAACGHSWQIVRTMGTGSRAHFGPFFVSLSPLSPKQPNHGHFGTDVESSIIQRVAWHPKGVGFAKAPLRQSEPGSNHLVRCVCFRPQSRPVIRRLRPAGRDPYATSASRLGAPRMTPPLGGPHVPPTLATDRRSAFPMTSRWDMLHPALAITAVSTRAE
jgi:hypothetical protein